MVGDHLSRKGFYGKQQVISAAMQMIQVVSSVCIVTNFYVIETTCFVRQVTLQWFILLKIPNTWDDQKQGLLPLSVNVIERLLYTCRGKYKKSSFHLDYLCLL